MLRAKIVVCGQCPLPIPGMFNLCQLHPARECLAVNCWVSLNTQRAASGEGFFRQTKQKSARIVVPMQRNFVTYDGKSTDASSCDEFLEMPCCLWVYEGIPCNCHSEGGSADRRIFSRRETLPHQRYLVSLRAKILRRASALLRMTTRGGRHAKNNLPLTSPRGMGFA